jgi:hypothetical protein
MKDGDDVRKMREIAEQCFALVREYKGSHSGEHGDGIVRSEFNEPMFGARITRAFEAVKDIFDPTGLSPQPGRPRAAHGLIETAVPLRAGLRGRSDVTPALDWSAWPGPQGGLLGAVEMCNNNGTCRKFDAGTMCPSWRATREEKHLTRGRANTLRLALTGQLEGRAGLRRGGGCALALRRLQGLQARMPDRRRHGEDEDRGRPCPRAREGRGAEGPHYRDHAALGALCRDGRAALNAHGMIPGMGWLTERMLGFAAGRALPRFRRDAFRDRELREPDGREGEVILLPDLFNRYFEPENIRAAIRVLRAAGADPAVARAPRGTRPLDEGRTYLAAGMVEEARAEARRTAEALSRFEAPVLGLEPSTLLTLRDEFLSLLPGEATDGSRRAPCSSPNGWRRRSPR